MFISMFISYKAHNRCTQETFLKCSDVYVNMFSELRSIPSGTMKYIWEVMFEPSQIATVTNCDNSGIAAVAICDLSQFVIKALMWHIDSNNTEHVFWVLGRVPRFTFDMNIKNCIFAHFGVFWMVYQFLCISVIKSINDAKRKPSWNCLMSM